MLPAAYRDSSSGSPAADPAGSAAITSGTGTIPRSRAASAASTPQVRPVASTSPPRYLRSTYFSAASVTSRTLSFR